MMQIIKSTNWTRNIENTNKKVNVVFVSSVFVVCLKIQMIW